MLTPSRIRACSAISILTLAALVAAAPAPTLEEGFRQPPEQTKPSCYWYWISDNISKAGITRDLEIMAQVGIGEALIGNVDVNEDARGPVKVLTEEWWGMVEHAIREGGRLGVRVGLFNCPGWSQSGGPWVKPDQTMRYVAFSETRLQGPAAFEGTLPPPAAVFQDVAVLAVPAPAHDADALASRSPHVTCTPETPDSARLLDGKIDAPCEFPALTGNTPFIVDVKTPEPYTARALVLHPAPPAFAVQCEFQVADDAGELRTVRKFTLDRSNARAQVGFLPFGPECVSFAPQTSKRFRLIFSDLTARGGLTEIELTSAARVESYIQKQLGKMCQTPFPKWETYLWPSPPEVDSPALAIAPDRVINLTARMRPDGSLQWDAPAGEWIILRAAMTPTGVKNAPSAPEATGFEIDKMSRAAAAMHFDAFIGQLLKRLPATDRQSFCRVVADSYEMGGQNWTDDLPTVFRARYGYDPLPWLPVLTGRIVGNADQSDRFLWDLRRLVADCVATEYVGGLRELAEKNGLRLWLENYGHWGFPGEFLQYGGQSHDIGGEFWQIGELGLIELRAASSAAHTYGKPVVSAEAFTSAGPHWTMDPWFLKCRGDWACTEGINHFVLHVYIHQPSEETVPGVNAWFGTEFNRHNTWFKQAGPWIDYLRRTHFLLQQGHYVADVLYFIGEDAPKMTGARRPPLPPGYSFDYINAEVIRHRLQVRDGRFVLPDGMSYRLLVLPDLTTMRPEVLSRLHELVAAGGAILGAPPTRSPSLQHYPAGDEHVRKLAGELWTNVDGQTKTSARFGAGLVMQGLDVKAALDQLNVPPDVADLDPATFLWLHRTTPEGEIYFISNQQDRPLTAAPSFRVSGRSPELWDAVTAERRDLPAFRQHDGRTTVPLEFAPRQALFVVFRRPATGNGTNDPNFPAFTRVGEVTGPWTVHFDPRWGGPDSVTFDQLIDWTQRPEDGIRYYSGTATYHKTFDLPAAPAGQSLYLDLGEVANVARVKCNGFDLGLIWAVPRRVEITQAAQAKGNELEITVTNTWANRIIGDARLPPEQRLTKTVHPHLDANSPLLPAGLLGPVTIQTTARR